MAASSLARRAAPTNSDIVAAIGELHDCLHAVATEVTAVKTDMGKIRERVAGIEGYQRGIATKLRVPSADKPYSFLSRHKAAVTTFGAVFGAFTAFVTAYPLLRGMLLALDAYLSAHK